MENLNAFIICALYNGLCALVKRCYKFSNTGNLGQAETQPSSNTGAAFAHRGFSKDARIFKAILEGVAVDTQYTNIYSAISDYRMAIQLGYSYANIAVRIKILQALLPVELDEKASCAELEERISKF